MKLAIIAIFSILSLNSFSQAKDKDHSGKKSGIVTFITRLDISNATKDGIYLNGYVVNIAYEQAKLLNGRKIKVTGRVTIVKAIKNELEQRRERDTKYIEFPKIEVIKD